MHLQSVLMLPKAYAQNCPSGVTDGGRTGSKCPLAAPMWATI